MKGFIYTLATPENLVFYVGRTFLSINGRKSGHLSEANADGWNEDKNNIVAKYGKSVKTEEVENFDLSIRDSNTLENYWISQFKSWGFPLTNRNGLPKIKRLNAKPSCSLKIDPDVYAKLVKHCDENRLKINLFASDIISEKLIQFQAETVLRETSKSKING